MHPREFVNQSLVAASIAERDGFSGLANALVELAASIAVSRAATRSYDPEEQSDLTATVGPVLLRKAANN
jgi:hypothetical protein